VHRLAGELELSGWVLNDELGVLLEAEGSEAALAAFVERLSADAPPLARVERVTHEWIEPTRERGFRIIASERRGEPAALVSPDSATCEDCLAELFDPGDRRHR